MLKLENSIRGLSFSRVAFDLTIQDTNKTQLKIKDDCLILDNHLFCPITLFFSLKHEQ